MSRLAGGDGALAAASSTQRRASGVLVPALLAVLLLAPPWATAQAPLRKMGELDIPLLGISATVDPLNPVVPKNTASAVRIVVRAGGQELTALDVARFVGGPFSVQGELSGPGLGGAVTLAGPVVDPQSTASLPADALLLPLPGLTIAGDYALSSIRIVAGGRSVLDTMPSQVTVKVIDQILVTSVKTRQLTLEEIREKGIVIDSESYLGFQFTLGLKLESNAINFSFPVVFNRQGVEVPLPTSPPPNPVPAVTGVQLPVPTIIPLLLTGEGPDGKEIPLTLPASSGGGQIRIPSVLVIPGNVGYLKQFFSAQLYVANGAPVGSGLVVHDITGTILLPPAPEGETGLPPLTLPATVDGPQPTTKPVRGVGPDGQPGTADDTDTFDPAEQGQAEFLIRGEKEGFHTTSFDIGAILEGLPVGPVKLKGKASGGVLVRNAFFDMAFTVPSVVRNGEPFKMYVSVTNIGQSCAYQLSVTLDQGGMSGLRLRDAAAATKEIEELCPGVSKEVAFDFVAQRTGQVKATYLKLDTENGSTGTLNFTLAVTDRGVPLSPDTLVLPTAVDALPSPVIDAAMRVLGQAWSLANAPYNALRAGVIRTSKTVVTQKALALAEAGLRIRFGESQADAVRDIAFDFYGGSPIDPGFDQVLRQTDAGYALALAIGGFLADPTAQSSEADAGRGMVQAGGASSYEREMAQVAVSGPDFISFAIGNGSAGAAVDVKLTDSAGKVTVLGTSPDTRPMSEVTGAVLMPLGALATAPVLGLVQGPTGQYALDLVARAPGALDLSVTLPRGDGTFVRGFLSGAALVPGLASRLVIDPARPDSLILQQDTAGSGSYASSVPLMTELLSAQGPRLVSAHLIGPETLDGATPFGMQAALLFDRVVGEGSAAQAGSYQIPSNRVRNAKRQLSGRLVFLTLDQPEGRYVPTTVGETGVLDFRGVLGQAGTVPLESLIVDAGAIVTGRVLSADGTAVAGATVVYLNRVDLDCSSPNTAGLAQIATGGDGGFEFRFVRQDACGSPFELRTSDPVSGAMRNVTGYVRTAGERIVLDIALLGRGSVAGRVLDPNGVPAGGASVVVRSVADAQSGAAATTDGDGRYLATGISVGAVSVMAVKGVAVGRGVGRIDRAGTTAAIDDIQLLEGFVSASGKVIKVENGEESELPGVQVVYLLGTAAVGVTQSGPHGEFAFDHMPAGAFTISAALNTRDRGEVKRPGATGEVYAGLIVPIVIPPLSSYGTVKGTVWLPAGPDGTPPAPAGGAVVWVGNSGVATDATTGQYTIPGITVMPGQSQTVHAQTRDGRTGQNRFLLSSPGEVVEGVDIMLSGLGSAHYTVLDAEGDVVSDYQLVLQLGCDDPCGCAGRTTQNGVVTFDNVRIGTHNVQAVRQASGYIDVARASATVVQNGITGYGVMRFPGAGTVKGRILTPDGKNPVMGAVVTLSALAFEHNPLYFTCGLTQQQREFQTGQDGTFVFNNVNVGPVSVTARQDFYGGAGASATLSSHGATVDFQVKLRNVTAGTLTGTVFLPDGTTPAGPGVAVTANGPLPDVTVPTDAQGAYHFVKILPEGGYTLTVNDAVTGAVAREGVYLAAAQDVVHNLRLKGRGTVRVTVVDGNGDPVPTAQIKLRETDFPNRLYERVLDPSTLGAATFESVFEGPISVEASDVYGRGGRVNSTVPRPGGTTVDVKVSLTTTGTVKGRFVMPDQARTPIPYGTVRLTVGGRVIGQMTTVGTGAEVGSFSFDFVPAGNFRLDGQDPATGRTGFAVGVIDAQDQAITRDVLAQALGTVKGQITQNGVPEPQARVTVESTDYRVTTYADTNGTCGPDPALLGGCYVVPGVPEGRITVTASRSDGTFAASKQATLSGENSTIEVDLALRSTGNITGTVVSAVDGVTPAPASTVSLSVGGLSTTSDPETGAFSFQDVPAGPVTVNVHVLGSIDEATATAVIPENDAVVVPPIKLNGVGGIEGIAYDSAGQPTAGYVTVSGAGAYGYSRSFQTGSSGRFRFPELLAGPFTAKLNTTSGAFTLWGSATGSILPGQVLGTEESPFVVRVQDSGSVSGTVLRSNETPAYGASVKLTLLDSPGGSFSTQAQTNGEFEFAGVPLVRFRVDLNDPVTAGRGQVSGRLETNGQLLDLGPILLDDTPVSVVGVIPADGSTLVPLDQPVQIVFSDALQNTGGISVSGLSVNAALSADGKTVTLTPYGKWPDSRTITISITTGVTDIYGRHPVATVTSQFTTVDITPPSVLGMVPTKDSMQVATNGLTVTVTLNEPLSAPDPAAIDSLVVVTGPAGALAGAVQLAPPNQLVFTTDAVLASDSRYSVSVNGAADLSGNVQTSASNSWFWTLDTVPPTIAFSSSAGALTEGSWLKTVTPELKASFSDALTKVEMTTAGLTLDGVSGLATTGTNALTITPAAPLAEGSHVLVASVSDKAGNPASANVTFGIDVTAPVAGAVMGVPDDHILSGTMTLTASVAEAGSGLARVDLLVDGAAGRTFALANLRYDLDSNTLSEGPHRLAVRATDKAGNTGAVGPELTVTVSNHDISVTIPTPARDGLTFGDSVTVVASPSEPVDRVEFTVGAVTAVVSAAPYQALLDLKQVPEGQQTITVRAFGQGEAGVASRTIVVDHTPPLPPNGLRVSAQPLDASKALVLAQAGAVEKYATVEIENAANEARVSVAAVGDGSFAAGIAGVEGQTLRLRAVDAVGNASSATDVVIGPKQTSGGVPLAGLQLWLKADAGVVQDATGHVSSWQDQSVNGNDATQPAAGSQPVWVADSGGGFPALRFDGSGDFLALNARIASGRTVFLVLRHSRYSGQDGYQSPLGDNGNVDTYTGRNRSIWINYDPQAVRDGETWLNGPLVDGLTASYPDAAGPLAVLTSIATGPVATANVGAYWGNGNFWQGDIAEVLIYNVALSARDRRATEDYLALKYGCYVPKTTAPLVVPNGGLFVDSTTVSLSSTSPGAVIRYTLDGSDPVASATAVEYLAPFTLDRSATIEAVATAPGLATSEITTVTLTRVGDFSPASVAGLLLWLAADAGIETGIVDVWRDQSGNRNDAVQTSGKALPSLVTDPASGMPMVRFDGTSDFLALTSRIANGRTVFLALRNKRTSGYYSPLGETGAVDTYTGLSRSIWNSVASDRVEYGETWLNGVPVDGRITNYPDPSGPLAVLTSIATGPVPTADIGCYWSRGNFWYGDIAEVIIYGGALSGVERHQVEEYLMRKYESVPNLPPSAPSATPNGGVFTGATTVALQTTTPGATIYYNFDGSDPDPDTALLYDEPFSITRTTIVKAKAFLDALESATAVFQFFESTEFNPASVAGLQLWLRADAIDPSSGFVRVWPDQSGQGNDAVQTAGGAIPSLATDPTSGMPMVRFDGSSDFLALTNRIASGQTVFLALRNRRTSGYYSPLGETGSVDTYTGRDRYLWNSVASDRVEYGETWLNGVPVDGRATSYPDPSGPLAVLTSIATGPVPTADVGCYWSRGNFWYGDIAEVIIYGAALSGVERHQVEEYLMRKYASVPNLPPSAPSATPNGGVFTGTTTVALQTTTPGATVYYTLDGTVPDPATAILYEEPFSLTQTTVVKAQAFLGSLASTTAAIGFDESGDFNPTSLTDLQLWLRSDAGVDPTGGFPNVWRDQSGNGNDARQTVTKSIPSLATDTASGMPTMRFDGTSDFLKLKTRIASGWTVFLVLRNSASGGYKSPLGDNGNVDTYTGLNRSIWIGNDPWVVLNGETWLNGIPVSDGRNTYYPDPSGPLAVLTSIAVGPVATANVGAYWGDANCWRGDIAEVAIYGRQLDAADAKKVATYLAKKYKIVSPYLPW